jgi:hypothetical protein
LMQGYKLITNLISVKSTWNWKYAIIGLFQSVVTKDVTSGKVTKAAEKAQKKK